MRKVIVSLAAASLGLALAGCGQDSNSGGDDGGKGTIGIAMPTKVSERWVLDGDNMVKQFEKLGYKTDLQYGDNLVENQVSQVENMITKGDKALVIASIDAKSLTSVLNQAAQDDIPVISYDRLIMDSEHVSYYATFDNFKVGQIQAQYIVDNLGLSKGKKGPFNIELFGGAPDDNNSRFFFDGAMDVLKPYFDKKQLVVKSGQTQFNKMTIERWDPGKAQGRMDTLLPNYTHDNLDAVLSPYDGLSIGIISSLKGAGYGTAKKPMPIVTGQDAEVASVKSIIRGEQTQTVYKDTRQLAKVTVEMVDKVLNGGKPQVNDTKSYNNGKKVVPSYLLMPVSVDKSNYQKALVDSGYIKASDLK